MSYGSGGNPMADTVHGQKADMQFLNDKLSDYINRVRALRKQGAQIDPAKYHELMQQLEEEMTKTKGQYERELDRLRKLLEDACRQKNELANNQIQGKAQLEDLMGKLNSEADKNRRFHDDINKLQATLAAKEKEAADLRGCCEHLKRELEGLKPNSAQLSRDNQELQRRLAEECKRRGDAEEKLKQLNDKLNFDSQRNCESSKDLEGRLRAANGIIQCLESKLKKLSETPQEDVGRLLQKMRDANMSELRKYQQETESALNKNMGDLKTKLDNDAKEKERLKKENDQLQECVRHLQGKLGELEGQMQGLIQQNNQLKGALDKERSNAQQQLRDLDNKNKELAELVMNSQKEFTNARDAQANLRTEISTYKSLLDVEDGRLKTQSDAMGNSSCMARSAGPAPMPTPPINMGSGSARAGNTGTGPYGSYPGRTEYTWAYGRGKQNLPNINGGCSANKNSSSQFGQPRSNVKVYTY